MGHTYHSLSFHIVFSTKERLPIIDGTMCDKLCAYMAGIINNGYGFTRKINGTTDHVHILADIKPTHSPSDLLREIKANSSRWTHETFSSKTNFAWQSGFGIFSVSFSLVPKVIHYIENQEKHHRSMTFQEEYLQLLQRHNVQYDPRYIWD